MKKLLLLFLFTFSLLDARVVFLHIPKTGGMTLLHLLRQNYPESSVYPALNLGGPPGGLHEATSVRRMEEAFTRYPDMNHELVMGHFPIWFHKEKNLNFDQSFVFTILRDPIKRVLSQDRYHIAVRSWTGMTGKSNPEAIPRNCMCLMLASDPTLKGEALLRNAIANLEKIDKIIFMDDFDNGVQELFDQMGLELPLDIPVTNSSQTEDLHKRQRINKLLLRKLEALNSLDVQLYEYAITHLR